MKEQDIIRKIEEETSKITIPESVSPEAMKKMLLEEKKWDGSKLEDASEIDEKKDKTPLRQKQRKMFGGLVAVAGLAICLTVGGIATIRYAGRETSDGAMIIDRVPHVFDKSEKDKYKDSLSYSSDYESPETYEDYYDVLSDAYDDYQRKTKWDTIINSGKDMGMDMVDESVAVEESVMEESAMQDSASDNSFRGESNAVSTEAGSSNQKTGDYSKTNNQEQNIEESDIVKTDGTYIYKLYQNYDSSVERGFRIIKAENGNMKSVATIDLEGTIRELEGDNAYIQMQEFYLYDDYLVFMYCKNEYAPREVNETVIMLYDISNSEKPSLKQVLRQTGWYASSRISDGYLYTISRQDCDMESGAKYYEDYVPCINGEPIACTDIYYEKDYAISRNAIESYVITSLDLSNPTEFTSAITMTADASQFYVSSKSIYFYATKRRNVRETQIVKVDYEKGKLHVGNTVCVAGYVYDSFAFSEYNGYLRMVATIGGSDISLLRVLGDDATIGDVVDTIQTGADMNVLYVFDSDMNMTGKILNIAPGEVIYSARYFGDTGYFVTYKNMDPLFSVDLSDPYNPRIIGALKIPGFSNYLHFYGDGLLLGLGEERDPDTQQFEGLKLSMFDISNPANVTESDKYIIEGGSYSPALANHKALMISTDKNVFGFEYYGYGNEDNNYTMQHYYVTYTYKNGFVETAKYIVEEDYSGSNRGLYIGDYFYLVTEKGITSYKLGSEQPLETVYFQ